MSTDKLRIQAYLPHKIYYQFDSERLKWGISQSQALERILSERYQSDITNEAEGDCDLMPLTDSINELRTRVSMLEDELESKLLSKLENRFSSQQLSESKGKSLGNLPTKKGSLKDKWRKEVEDKYAWSDGYCRLRLQNGGIFVGLICSVSKQQNTCKIFDCLTDTQLNVEIDRLVLPGELESELDVANPHSQRA